tara:strand:+ start:739 stop:1335 length:597 start_codon:yes stop_codon:yes gene_type:complete
MAKQSKVKKIVTEKIRKKYGACEHDSVSFKALEKLCDKQQSYCRTRDRIIDRLTREIDRKGALIDDWTQSRGRWINDVNQSLLKKTAKHNQEVKDLEGLIEELTEANKELRKVNKDCISINTNIIKDHQEITRAYKGLHEMGKFAEDEGIDVKRHYKMLPEDKDQFYDFKQSHKLLESGKVLHQWSMKKKKKVEDTND